MSLVFERQIDGPATHAIVIGVGAYAHLPGGDGVPFPDHQSMEQLTSPPHSARAFAKWLTGDYRNPTKPLASLDLLISEAQGNEFTLPNGEVKQIEPAILENVDRAVLTWKDRGDKSPDHLMIFFFCGHGITGGPITSLLLEDFGKRSDRPLKQAIDFNSFYQGMAKCKARQQCYFVDACRVASPTLIEAHNYAGEPIIYGSTQPSGKRRAPVYYSTVLGSRAYGRTDAPSVFTEVLIRAFDGAGSDDVDGDWRVDTQMLNRGISYLLEREIGETTGLEQVCPVDGLTRFTLHYLDRRPVVPVTVGCRPTGANNVVVLSYCYMDGSNEVERLPPQSSDWNIDVEEGTYCFSAKLKGRTYRPNNEGIGVRPPFRRVNIEVTS